MFSFSQGPILDCCWHDDGTKVFMASCDKQVKCWDLATNQALQVAEHGAPVKSVRWVKAPNYTALMTGSWDKGRRERNCHRSRFSYFLRFYS